MTADISAPAIVPERPNSFQRIYRVILEPVATLREIAERPDWLIPMLLMIVISSISTIIMVQHFDLESAIREQIGKSGATESEIAGQLELIMKIQKYSMIGLGAFGPPLQMVICAALFLLTFRVFGASGRFAQFFSVAIYGWIPMLIKSVVMTLVLFTKGLVDQFELLTLVRSNLGFLVNPREQALAFSFLSSLDAFTIWTIILYVIGFAFVAKVSRGKAAAAVLFFWGVWVVIKLGLAAMQASGGA